MPIGSACFFQANASNLGQDSMRTVYTCCADRNRRKELSASVFTKKFSTQMGLGKSSFCVSRKVAAAVDVGPFLDQMSRARPTDDGRYARDKGQPSSL